MSSNTAIEDTSGGGSTPTSAATNERFPPTSRPCPTPGTALRPADQHCARTGSPAHEQPAEGCHRRFVVELTGRTEHRAVHRHLVELATEPRVQGGHVREAYEGLPPGHAQRWPVHQVGHPLCSVAAAGRPHRRDHRVRPRRRQIHRPTMIIGGQVGQRLVRAQHPRLQPDPESPRLQQGHPTGQPLGEPPARRATRRPPDRPAPAAVASGGPAVGPAPTGAAVATPLGAASRRSPVSWRGWAPAATTDSYRSAITS